MIGIYKKETENIPYLIIVEHNNETVALPTVIYSHGFTSAKEHNLPLAYLLAEKGFRVILPDSKYHGERDEGISMFKKELSFWDIVMQNVKEIKIIKEELEQEGLILNQKIGLAGTSMGGITTSAAMTQYPWISTAAVLMGTPKLTEYAHLLVDHVVKGEKLPIPEQEIEKILNQLKEYDLSLNMDSLVERPLLFWHGDKDTVVPFNLSYTFYREARKQYKNKNNIKFLKETNRDHKVSRYAILETVKWFETYLI